MERGVIFHVEHGEVGGRYSPRDFRVKEAGEELNFSTVIHGRDAGGTTLEREEVEMLHESLGVWLAEHSA